MVIVLSACVNVVAPQAAGGESLTCHAPVTSPVGRTGLSSWYWKSDPSSSPRKTPPLSLDEGRGNKQGVPDWENGFCRLFSLFGGNAEILRPVLPVTRPRIGLQVDEGAGRDVNFAYSGCDWFVWEPIPGTGRDSR